MWFVIFNHSLPTVPHQSQTTHWRRQYVIGLAEVCFAPALDTPILGYLGGAGWFASLRFEFVFDLSLWWLLWGVDVYRMRPSFKLQWRQVGMLHDYVACRPRPSPGLRFKHTNPIPIPVPSGGGGRTRLSLLLFSLFRAWFVWQLVRGVFELCKSAKTRRNGLICRAPSIDVILSDLPSIGDVVFNEFFPLLSVPSLFL